MRKALKICNKVGCNNLTREVYCEEHKELRQENRREANRYYNRYKRDDWTKKFYVSSRWLDTRNNIILSHNGLDLYEYYINHKIVEADIVHHIVELNEDKDKALDIDNLIPVSTGAHNTIHALYNKSYSKKKETQELLLSLLRRWNNGERI